MNLTFWPLNFRDHVLLKGKKEAVFSNPCNDILSGNWSSCCVHDRLCSNENPCYFLTNLIPHCLSLPPPSMLITMTCCMIKIGSLSVEGRESHRATDSDRWTVTLREFFQHIVTGIVATVIFKSVLSRPQTHDLTVPVCCSSQPDTGHLWLQLIYT